MKEFGLKEYARFAIHLVAGGSVRSGINFLKLLGNHQICQTYELNRVWDAKALSESEFEVVMKKARDANLADYYLKKDDIHSRFASQFLASGHDYKSLPESFQVNGINFDGSKLAVNVRHMWRNCNMSETKMGFALNRSETVLVNGFLLVKGVGYKSGLCIETTATEKGTFLKGGWYTPEDPVSKEAIELAFNGRVTEIELPEGKWAYIRDVGYYLNNHNTSALMNRVEVYLAGLKITATF